MRKGTSKTLRRLSVLPVALALTMALVVPATALAAEPLSGYTTTTTTTTTPTTTPTTTATTTPAPTTTTTATTPTPTSGTSPEKQTSTPEKSTAPETTKKEPTSEPTATTAKKATTLPFTGFDLRWTIGAGVLLMAMGFSLLTAQRRQRRNGSR